MARREICSPGYQLPKYSWNSEWRIRPRTLFFILARTEFPTRRTRHRLSQKSLKSRTAPYCFLFFRGMKRNVMRRYRNIANVFCARGRCRGCCIGQRWKWIGAAEETEWIIMTFRNRLAPLLLQLPFRWRANGQHGGGKWETATQAQCPLLLLWYHEKWPKKNPKTRPTAYLNEPTIDVPTAIVDGNAQKCPSQCLCVAQLDY